jgi:type IX secretion system PorP/SprF family membrane protein
MKNTILPILILLVSFTTKAQQDPSYTQYMYNMNVVNPAYAGSKEAISFSLLHREQWVGVDGAPSTSTLAVHSPIQKQVGLGLSAISDKIGPVEEQNIYGDFSYTINLNDKNKLALGLKAGFTLQKIGFFSEVFPTLPTSDNAFRENSNQSNFNLGTGLFYNYSDKFYFGASIPNMLKSSQLDYNGRQYGTEEKHYFITTGYVFDINDNLKFKPSTLVKSSLNAPISLDVSTNFLLYKKFEIGASYRVDDSFSGLVNIAVSNAIRIGYAYDSIISNLNTSTTSSHEFILLFDLNFAKKVSSSSRFF